MNIQPTNPTRAQKVAELEAEMLTRRRMYPILVRRGKMKVEEAARRTRIMQAILDDYRREGDLFGMGGTD